MEPAQGKVRVAINGFGRIGRNAFKVAVEDHEDELEIVAINDLTEPKVLAHLLEYDTAYGHWDKDVSSSEEPSTHGSVTSKGALVVEGKKIPIFAEKDPKSLPWKDLNVDVVIESTGRFADEEGMRQHLTAGAKRVVLSAPAKGDGVPTILIGVNHNKYQNEELINNGSCTTNCIAPIAAIIHGKFGVKKALMTTIHSVTAEQNLVDGPPPGGKSGDLRRARAAYANMIPTTTGAAEAVTQAIPELKGLFDGRAIRVPTIVGSISDFTFLLAKPATVEEINQTIKDACETPRWKGVVAWTEEPLVSSDIIGRSESSIVDLELTQVVDGDLVKIFAWYDNEWGYSNRLVEQVINVGKTVGSTSVAASDQTHPTPSAPTPPTQPDYSAGAGHPSSPPLTSRIMPLPVKHDFNPPTPTATPKHEPLVLPPNEGHPPIEPKGFFAADYKPQPFDFHSKAPEASVNHLFQPSAEAGQHPTPPFPHPSPPGPPPYAPAPIAAPTPTPTPPAPGPGTGHPGSHANPPPPTDQKPDEPKIEDHVVTPEEEAKPKNNPFLDWFK